MMFYVGQKVVCVHYEHQPNEPASLVKKGEVYTVANVYWTDDDDTGMIELVEIYSPETVGWWAGFEAACFRPVVERKTNISIFTEMLTPSSPRVIEPVK